jgi:Amj-like protein
MAQAGAVVMLESNGMDSGLLVICALTFVIHLIGTLAYSVRIAGTRTRRIALSLSLFNVLVLISRTSNSFQAPLLAKRVETNIAAGVAGGLNDFRWLLASATAATVLGAVLIPTFQRLLTRWVTSLEADRSPLRTFRRLTSPAVAAHIRESVVLPRWTNVTSLRHQRVSWGAAVVNTFAVSMWSVGVFAALYAGYLRPELRVTASQLSSVVNGVATILMFVFLDPYLSFMTDDVAAGKVPEPHFRRSVVVLTGTRLAGTMLAQVILVPAALWIVAVAEWL